MDLVCYNELTNIEKNISILAIVAGALVIILGLMLIVFRNNETVKASLRDWNLFEVTIPVSVFLFLGGIILIGGDFYYYVKKFPEDSISFSQREWKLVEIKNRLENAPGKMVTLVLQGNARNFIIDRKITGSCKTDLINNICSSYDEKLKCDIEANKVIVQLVEDK